MNIPAIVVILIMVIGFAFALIFCIISLKRINGKSVGYKKAKGNVVDFIEKFHYKQFERRFYPIVRYKVDNKEYEIVGKIGYGFSLFMPKKITVMYNPQNPEESELSDLKKLFLKVIVAFSIAILSMMFFLVNDIILDNTMKYYEYRIICNVDGYVYDTLEGREAKSKSQALELIKEKYKNWKNCNFEEVNLDID